MIVMTKDQVKEILDRVLTWPQEDQDKVARYARAVEQRRGDDITDEEWAIIEARAARRQSDFLPRDVTASSSPGESRHKDVRYLDIHEDELDEAQLAAWVKQASLLPGERM